MFILIAAFAFAFVFLRVRILICGLRCSFRFRCILAVRTYMHTTICTYTHMKINAVKYVCTGMYILQRSPLKSLVPGNGVTWLRDALFQTGAG